MLYLVENLLILSNNIYAGSFSDVSILSAAGIAASLTSIFGLALVGGFINGFNTLASAAMGARNFTLVGHLFNKL